MGMLDFLKKKKRKELPLPPPPAPPELPPLLKGDIEPIRAAESLESEMHEQYQEPQKQFEFPRPKPLMEMPRPEMHEYYSPELRPEYELPAPSGEKEVQVFDKTVARETVPEREEPEMVRHMPSKPAFVDVDDYKRIINDTNVVRSKLMEAEAFVRRLGDLKNEEERTFEKWRAQLEGIEKKLSYVDKIIAKAG